MRDFISAEQIVDLVSKEFTIIKNAKTLYFIGDWQITDLDEKVRQYADFDSIICLEDINYVIHPADRSYFNDILSELRSKKGVHFRLRLLTPDLQVKQLDASGQLVTTGKDQNIPASGRHTTFLLTLTDVIGSLHAVRRIQQATCRLLCEHLNAGRVYVAEYKNDHRITINVDFVCSEEISRTGTFRNNDFEPLTSLIQDGKTSVINDTFNTSEVSKEIGSTYSSKGVRAQVAVPFIDNGELLGALVVTHISARNWTPDEIYVIEETSRRLWKAAGKAAAIATLYDSVQAYSEEIQRNFELLRQSEEIAGFGSWDFNFASGDFKWSDGMYKLFDMQNQTRVVPEVYLDYVIEEDREIAERIVNQFRNRHESFEETLRFRIDAKTKTLKVKGSVLYENQRPARLIGVDLDISALVESRDELIEYDHTKSMYSELKKLYAARTNFFNNITHEFRTPLTLLLGPLEEVIRKSGSDLPPRQRDQLVLAQRHAVRLQKLVNTLLEFSRIESGTVDPVFVPTDICAYTSDIAGAFKSAIEEAGLTFLVHCTDVSEFVYLDRSMYENILLNLLSNAFKFTFQGKIEVRIRELNKHVELIVSDTGIGVSPSHHKTIFERFHRVEGVASRTYEGTGIGLAMIKEMVKLHGGNIFLKSVPGEGSDFIVRIPKGKEHLPQNKISDHLVRKMSAVPGYLEEIKSWLQPVPASSPATESHFAKPVVMIVDDNHDMRSYLTNILESRYKVIGVENGQRALEVLETGLLPDLVLTDVMMPGLDGYQLLSEIKKKELPNEMPVILLTAQAAEDFRVKGLDHGADDYLVKPFSSRELLARVDSRIQIARMRNEVKSLLETSNKDMERLVVQRTHELMINNEALERRNRDLNALNEELAGLTFAAGHDLREPLRKMRFFVHRLMKEDEMNLSSTGKQYFNKIVGFAQTMSDLVSDLGLYSYYTENSPRKTSVNLDVILFIIKEFLSPILQAKNATLTISVAPVMTGDPDQVKKVLLNLISNALKFRRPNAPLDIVVSGKILEGKFIEDKLAEKNRIYYELEVRDNGTGFEQQYEKQIFQLFRKLHGRSLSPGTGIGLTIVRKIVVGHGGFVTAKSSLGLGASFKCYFPQ